MHVEGRNWHCEREMMLTALQGIYGGFMIGGRTKIRALESEERRTKNFTGFNLKDIITQNNQIVNRLGIFYGTFI